MTKSEALEASILHWQWLICTTPSDDLAIQIVQAVNAYGYLLAENERLRTERDALKAREADNAD